MDDNHGSAHEAVLLLFEQYGNEIRKYVRYMLGNWEDADDATQEIFARAFMAWHQYTGQAQARTWLWAITRNHVKDLLRAKKRKLVLYSHLKSEAYSVDGHQFTDYIELEEAVSSLRESYRQVIILRYIQDISVESTAMALGWTQSKVRTMAHRALKELRNKFTEIDMTLSAKEGDGYGV